MFNYDDIKNINRKVRDIEEATRFARDSGLLDSVKRMAGQRSSMHDTAVQQANEAAARLREEPMRQAVLAQQKERQQMLERMSARVAALPSVDVHALISANRVAAQVLEVYRPSDFRELLPSNAEQLRDLVERATRLATATGTQDLLRRAGEAMASRATQEPSADTETLFELPDVPELNWMFQLDRPTLRFWCRFLFHLTFVLGPAMGVQVALSDGALETEDWPALLASLNVMLGYALVALNEKEKDED